MEKKLYAGYARMDITPEDSVPLAGYGNTLQRMSQGVLESLMATCIALTEEQGNTVLLFTVDIVSANDKCVLAARQRISEKYGIPLESVIIACTHTHSAPDAEQSDHPVVAKFITGLLRKLTDLAGQALDDRYPAEMACARTYNQGMNYVRHYILEDDTVAGDNFGSFEEVPIRCHVSEADREIRLVKFCREGAKDILLVNWQAHPNLSSTIATEYGRAHRPYISADYVGSCRRFVEENADVHFAFFQGAAGNLNSRSRIESEADTRDHNVYGKQLGEYVLEGLKNLKPLEIGKVAAATGVLHGRLNHTEDHLVPAAEIIREQWQKTNDPKRCMAMGKPYGIHSAYHAGAILRKAKLGTHMDLDMGAAQIGQLGIAVLPYEVFDTNGKYIREHSPFDMTLVFSCANGKFSYIPSEKGFAHGCYEADMCSLAPGTGEEGAQLAVDLLNDLYRGV